MGNVERVKLPGNSDFVREAHRMRIEDFGDMVAISGSVQGAEYMDRIEETALGICEKVLEMANDAAEGEKLPLLTVVDLLHVIVIDLALTSTAHRHAVMGLADIDRAMREGV